MTAYYNENDSEKAAWIRELIQRGIVAPGDVDERSITEVRADDLRGYTQCHFFAGIAVWSYALRLAGWPDDRAVWTGSCPCPSFSCAGKGEGFDDPRHLWPHWYPLVRECRPGILFGEQADDAIGFGWLDLVSGDLEAAEYAIAAAVLGAHSAGAPHIRQRLYFVGNRKYAAGNGLSQRHGQSRSRQNHQETRAEKQRSGEISIGADADGRQSGNGELQRSGKQRLLAEDCGTGQREHSAQRGFAMHGSAPGNGGHAAFADEVGIGRKSIGAGLERHFGDVREWRGPGWLDPHTARSVAAAGATRGFWADCDWWYGRDGKYRPIERGVFPLVNGASNRVLKLRGYGDAINAEVAKAFIKAGIIACHERTGS